MSRLRFSRRISRPPPVASPVKMDSELFFAVINQLSDDPLVNAYLDIFTEDGEYKSSTQHLNTMRTQGPQLSRSCTSSTFYFSTSRKSDSDDGSFVSWVYTPSTGSILTPAAIGDGPSLYRHRKTEKQIDEKSPRLAKSLSRASVGVVGGKPMKRANSVSAKWSQKTVMFDMTEHDFSEEP